MSSRERERNKGAAAKTLAGLPSLSDWLAAAPRQPSEIEAMKRLRAELRAMAAVGWESTSEFVSVNGKIQTVNGLPAKEWLARETAYQDAYRQALNEETTQ